MTSATPAQAPSPVTSSLSVKNAIIRDASTDDMAAIQAIYARHVLHGVATFEETPPSVQEMQDRHKHIVALGLPYLVAESDGRITGYCYAAPYRPRSASRYTLENSIYLDTDQTGQGLGKALLLELLERCEQGPWRQMIAVIAGTDNPASVKLHRSLGFEHVGTQPATGFKFNQWIDVIFMQRALGAGSTTPPTDQTTLP